MKKIIEIIKNQPALVIAFIGSGISLAVAFGLDLTAGQVGEIVAFTTAALGFVTRMLVSPARTVVAQLVDGEVVAGPAHPLPDGTPVAVITPADLVK